MHDRLQPRDDVGALFASSEAHEDEAQAEIMKAPNVGLVRKAQEANLHFISTTRNLIVFDDIELRACPVLVTHLMKLLNGARDDLKAVQQVNDVSHHYQWNSSEWSFNFVAPKEEIRFTAILAIVTKLIRLVPIDPKINSTWARVGRLDRGSHPVAFAMFVPSNSTSLLEQNSSSDGRAFESPSTMQEVTVTSILPYSVTNSTVIFDDNSVVFYNSSVETPLPKRQVPTEILTRTSDSMWALSVRLYRDREGGLVKASIVMFQLAILLSLAQYALGFFLTGFMGTVIGDKASDVLGLNSGAFQFGRMVARYEMRSMLKDEHGLLVRIRLDVWKQLAYAIIDRLHTLKEGSETYAVNGEIMGPDIVNGTDKQIVWGDWYLIAEEESIDHDEL
ncbi:MAG: hypothetical protein Q9190_000540 [Brigantiaea leucoxantha]